MAVVSKSKCACFEALSEKVRTIRIRGTFRNFLEKRTLYEAFTPGSDANSEHFSKEFLKVPWVRIVLTFSERPSKHAHFDLEMTATFRTYLVNF